VIECLYAVAAENVLLDTRTNQASAINLMEDVTVVAFPAVVPKLAVMFVLTRLPEDPEEVELSVRVLAGPAGVAGAPGAHEGFQSPATCSFGGARTTRVYLNFFGFVLTQAGSVAIVLQMPNGTELGRWTIQVSQAAVPNPQMQFEQHAAP
jgi:hypothetical protein